MSPDNSVGTYVRQYKHLLYILICYIMMIILPILLLLIIIMYSYNYYPPTLDEILWFVSICVCLFVYKLINSAAAALVQSFGAVQVASFRHPHLVRKEQLESVLVIITLINMQAAHLGGHRGTGHSLSLSDQYPSYYYYHYYSFTL